MSSKDRPAPKRPVTAFWLFMKDFRKRLGEPEVEFHTIVKLGGQEWRQMSHLDKKPYMKMHFEEKLRYTQSMYEYTLTNKRACKLTKPKPPPTAFHLFMSDFRKELADEEPPIKKIQATSKLGRKYWDRMSEEDKRPYELRQFEAKLRYSHSMEEYRLALENVEEDEDLEESEDTHLQDVQLNDGIYIKEEVSLSDVQLKDGIFIKEEAPTSKYATPIKPNGRKHYSPVWDYFDVTKDKACAVCKLCSKEVFIHSSSNQSLFRHLRAEHIDAELNPLSVTMPASRLSGDLWSLFEVIQDTKMAKCKICHNVFSFRTTIGNLRKHLRRAHKGKDVAPGAILPQYEFGEEEDDEDQNQKPVARKKVAHQRRSLVWNYFKIIGKTMKAACIICNKALGFTGSLLTMKEHLRKRHDISIPRKEKFSRNSSHVEVERDEDQLIDSPSEEEDDIDKS